MFRQDMWPFVPVRLSEIIDSDTLAVLQAGCCERLGNALTILDYAPNPDNFADRIDSVNLKQHWEPFCARLRDEKSVQGADAACRRYDLDAARISLSAFRTDKTLFRYILCHMGLQDASHIILVRGRPVALLYGGQRQSPEGSDPIVDKVMSLGSRVPPITVNEDNKEALIALAREIRLPRPDFAQAFQREAEHIQRIAEAQYENRKEHWEQSFLDDLRTVGSPNASSGLDALRRNVGDLLDRIRTFCRCDYALYFASVQENDTVLEPIAAAGLPASMDGHLPHFNWKKAGLPMDSFDARTSDLDALRKIGVASIRGDNSDYFLRARCVVPTSLGSRYRGVLVMGRFAEAVDLVAEQRFLSEIAETLSSYALRVLEVRYLEQERKRWHSTALLLTHQLRTALTPITTQIGRAKLLAQKLGKGDATALRTVDLLKRAEDLSINLADSARQTLEGHILQLQPEDLIFEHYSLSVLLANCLEGFVAQAEKQHRTLAIDRSVELLPEADVDVARLTIAISNLVDNALKYSYPGTTIHVRASVYASGDPKLAKAVIEIDDIGTDISEEDRERIFEQGERGRHQGRLSRIPGSGLGLWEAKAVVHAHKGEIGVNCDPVWLQRTGTQTHRVVFSVGIPLNSEDARKRGR